MVIEGDRTFLSYRDTNVLRAMQLLDSELLGFEVDWTIETYQVATLATLMKTIIKEKEYYRYKDQQREIRQSYRQRRI
jgi:hypothetical protein